MDGAAEESFRKMVGLYPNIVQIICTRSATLAVGSRLFQALEVTLAKPTHVLDSIQGWF